jgi:hypothetical protein
LEKLITDGKEITAKNVIMLQKPKMAKEALLMAINGDFERAKEMMEDAYINARFNVDDIIDELYEAIGSLNDREVKIRLYSRLSETEARCRLGNPLVQIVGFLSYVWIAPHLPKTCPALEGEA